MASSPRFQDGVKEAAKARPRVSCKDPVAASILKGQRAGRPFLGPTRAVDDLRRERDLRFYSPTSVADQIAHSVGRASDIRALALRNISGWSSPYPWRPILESTFCGRGPGQEKHRQSALRGFAAGAHWAQGRLRDRGASPYLRLLCQEERGPLR